MDDASPDGLPRVRLPYDAALRHGGMGANIKD